MSQDNDHVAMDIDKWMEKLVSHFVLLQYTYVDKDGGEREAIQVSTCLEYVEKRWGTLGKHMLRDLAKLCVEASKSQEKVGKFD